MKCPHPLIPDDQWLIPSIRTQTGPSVWCVMRSSWHSPDHSPSLVSQSELQPAFSFEILTRGDSGDGVVTSGSAQGPGSPGMWVTRAVPARRLRDPGPARQTGAAMRAQLREKWGEWDTETCEWWLCSHCMAPRPTTKYAKKWRPWGGHTLAPGLGFWPWLWQQTLLYRPQQPENHLGRPQRQVTCEQPGHTEHNIPSCFTFFVA